MPYAFIQDNRLVTAPQPPQNAQPFAQAAQQLVPPLVTELHRSFHAWGVLGYSPGPVIARRVWFDPQGTLAFRFGRSHHPRPLAQVGLAPDLAAWLVLLDHWMETFVVVARARAIWMVDELAHSLPFITPAFLPPALLQSTQQSWVRVARALAVAVLDGPLAGHPTDRHWQESPS